MHSMVRVRRRPGQARAPGRGAGKRFVAGGIHPLVVPGRQRAATVMQIRRPAGAYSTAACRAPPPRPRPIPSAAPPPPPIRLRPGRPPARAIRASSRVGAGSPPRAGSLSPSRKRSGAPSPAANPGCCTPPPAWARPTPHGLGPLLGPEGNPRRAAAADGALDHAAAGARQPTPPGARPRGGRAAACPGPWTCAPATLRRASARRQAKRLPTALVTTPESLSLLLARPDCARALRALRGVDRRRVARADGEQARRAGGARTGAPARLRARAARLGPVGDARQPRRGAAPRCSGLARGARPHRARARRPSASDRHR